MKEIIYNITQQTAGRVVVVSGLDEELTKDNVLGIINKTQSKVLYTPVQAANMLSASYQDGTMTISLAGNVPSINKGDELLVKLYSDKEIDLSAFAKESTLLVESQAIQSAIQNIDLSSVEGKVDEVKQAVENIDLTPIENKVQEGVNTLSTKIDSIKNIDNLAADIVAGKEKLASSISYKGVYSTSADSLEDMAVKIRRIPQVSAGDSADSGTEEDSAHYDSDSQFNPYLVAKALVSEQLPSYIPEYMYSYRNRYAPSSFLVGEYSGVNSIVLTGADGYLTSDGHFYSYANMGDYMQVTHTFPDGSIETYESTTIKHIWDVTSKKTNAFVVYYNYDSAYSFATDLNNVPLSAVICGKCTSFSYGGADVMRNIIVLGELEEYSTSVTNNKMNTNQVLPSKKLSSGYMFHYTTNIDSIVLPKLETLVGQIVNTGSNNTSVKSLCLPNLKSVTETYKLVKMTALEKFVCGIEEFPFTLYHNRRAFDIPQSLRILMYPKLKVVNGEYRNAAIINLGASIVEHVSLDSLEYIIGNVRIIGRSSDGSKSEEFPSLRTLYMPRLKRFAYGYVITNSYLTDLIDVTVGELETSIDFTRWTATNILADPDKTIQLQNNIHNHIAERVKDVTGESPLTITFEQGVRNILLPETEALFAAKNWNIAPTKTV